jgi:hypothetical protein
LRRPLAASASSRRAAADASARDATADASGSQVEDRNDQNLDHHAEAEATDDAAADIGNSRNTPTHDTKCSARGRHAKRVSVQQVAHKAATGQLLSDE